jgi:hypothetical protein
VKKYRDRYLAKPYPTACVIEDGIQAEYQTKQRGGFAMPNIKTISVTYHINEDTGKLVNVTRYDGSPGQNRVHGAITDCHGLVVPTTAHPAFTIFEGVWRLCEPP